ncbi:hypothetical protein DMN91_013064 [Ooceraea biroi]|uniref:CCHC-type domain-containing protein n=1 Tax=Ooceraea biroi TaxID=2015173 RepID=A0A3L8D327_OOCBI|nr:uncharacterized protein LOC105287304 [Ooceraea biroi]RLU14666.1 hypothetical protein DMN91_013064 [Ooceraea biroi]
MAKRQGGSRTLGLRPEVTVTRLVSRDDDKAKQMVHEKATKQQTIAPGNDDDVIILEDNDYVLRKDSENKRVEDNLAGNEASGSEMSVDEASVKKDKRQHKTIGMKIKDEVMRRVREDEIKARDSDASFQSLINAKRKRREEGVDYGSVESNLDIQTGDMDTDDDLDATVMDDDTGRMDMVMKYADGIQKWTKELDELRLDNEKVLKREVFGRMLELQELIRTGGKRLMLYFTTERMNRSGSEELRKEVSEMRGEMGELKRRNIRLEGEIIELKKKNTYLQQEIQKQQQKSREPMTVETMKSNGYSAAVKRSTQQQQQAPETEKNKISKVKKNGGRTGMDGARDEVAERLLEQLENLRRCVMDYCGKGKDEACVGKDNEKEEEQVRNMERNRITKRDQEWTVVQRRGAGRNKEGRENRIGEKRTPRVVAKPPPTTEAVVITCEDKESGGMELIRRAKRNISLEGLGIAEVRTRKTATGATLIQITGEGRKDKADALAGKLKEFFGEARVKVNRPVKRTELRLRGLEEGTTMEEVKSVVARIGEGSEEEVRVGRIAWNRMGYGSVLVTCTAETARRLMEKEERIRIGWARIYVERIAPRALRCYRCLENGHTGVTCDNSVDRSGTCFKCGSIGHKAKDCQNPTQCSACVSMGIEGSHVIGGPRCNAHTERRKRMESENTGGAG